MKKIIFASLFVLTACGGGGGGDSDDDNSIGGMRVESLEGVWDDTDDHGADGEDEKYIVIDKSGYVSYYDYAGDTFDEWGNCYWISEKSAQLTHISANRYTIRDLETMESGQIELYASRSILTVTEADLGDADDDGNTTETRTIRLDKSSKTVADFKPECVDSEAAARALIPAKREKTIPF